MKSMKSSASGYTIVELLIASSVFTMVLILITTGILQFSRQYYKGVISGKTQDTTRAIVDDVVRAVQLNPGDVMPLRNVGGPMLPSPVGYCIGEVKRYSFYRNQQVTDNPPFQTNQGYHALITDNYTGCNANSPALNARTINGLPASGRELLGQNMRLVKFAIDGVDDLYTITVRVVYGDNDLLCSPTSPATGNCGPNASFPGLRDDLTCKTSAGAQFCAVSELSTTVQKRVN